MNETRQQVEDTLERIQTHKGVVGVVVVNDDNIPIRSTLDNATTLQYVSMCDTLCGIARGIVRDTDPQNDLKILRVRTKKNEIIIAPEAGKSLIVIQAEEHAQLPLKVLLEWLASRQSIWAKHWTIPEYKYLKYSD